MWGGTGLAVRKFKLECVLLSVRRCSQLSCVSNSKKMPWNSCIHIIKIAEIPLFVSSHQRRQTGKYVLVLMMSYRWCERITLGCNQPTWVECDPIMIRTNGLWWVQTAWWRHHMETFSTLLAICAGNSAVAGEFPPKRPVTRSFDVFFHLCLNKRLSKTNIGEVGDLKSHRTHYDVIVMRDVCSA